jgi:hypothetical protein
MLKSKSQKGIVLVAVVIFTLILTILGFSVLFVANSEIAQTRKDINKTKAFYLAEAGVERLVASLSSGNTANIGQTALGEGSYSVDINTNGSEPCAVATAVLGGEVTRIQVEVTFLAPPYECGIYAGGMGGGGWTLMLRGTGDPCIIYSGGKSVGDVNGKDIVNGNIFADGNVALYQQSSVHPAPAPNTYNLEGDVNVTGHVTLHDSSTISGEIAEGSAEMSPPGLLIMNYAVNNTHNVTKIFDSANVTHGAPPSGNPLRDVFQINPTDRATESASTDGNDYYLDLHSGSSSYVGGAWNTAPTPINVGTDRIYYIDGNLWINSKSDTFGYNMSGKATIIVTGNIYICDNLKYANPSTDVLGLVALGKYNSSGQRVSGGDIIFGDPSYGTMYTMSGMLFAAHDFLFNTRAIGTYSGEPESGFILNGSMTALNHISLERDWYTSSGTTRRPARYDPSTSQWYDSGTGVALTSAQIATMKHYRMVVNYDDRVRSRSTQPKGLPRGVGLIYSGIANWKVLP